MEEKKIDSIINSYQSNKSVKLFFEKFYEKRNIIFEHIYNALKHNDNEKEEEENKMIQEILNQEKVEDFDKIQSIKELKVENYIKNYKKNYKPEQLQKYNLGLITASYPNSIMLVFYGNKEELKKYKIDEINTNECSDEKNKKESENLLDKNENKEKLILMEIEFINKIKINEDEEWICNPNYAIYLIYNEKNLKNPHPYHEKDDDSSYSLRGVNDIEHFIFITNNKYNREKKILEIKAELDISNIYNDIKIKDTSYKDYINNYLKVIDHKEIDIKRHRNNKIALYFEKLDEDTNIKNIIFQDQNILNSFYKIIFLNNLYYEERLRFFYLDLKILNGIKNTNEKRKYLSYYIARVYNCNNEFENDFENFVNENLKQVRDKNFINDLIDKILDKNNNMIEKYNEDTPFYIIIDNIDSNANYKLMERLMHYNELKNTYIYGIINIDTTFGQEQFMKFYNKKNTERGFYVHYLNSNNSELVNKNDYNLTKFFNDIGKNINILKDFLQLIYFKKYFNEYTNNDNNFLMKYIKYIKLIITEDSTNRLSINDIEFKNEEIKKKFIQNYKDILLFYLNQNGDEIIEDLFSELNSILFEKQIILDILLDKIKSDKERNFKELNVHTIYCMNFNLEKIDISQYKEKDIIIIQDSQTGEVYDFGIIVNNNVKLYQVSTNKSKEDLKRLEKNKIEFDCNYMNNKYLNNFGEYTNFSFGIITSTVTFNKYSKLLGEKKDISNTPYYLMKNHCQKNNYELFIYDLIKQKIYIEDASNKLIEYNLYKFNNKNELKIPKLKEIYSQKPKKISMNRFNKENFIQKLKDTKLFSGLDKDENKNSLNVVGKFDYQNKFLKIGEVEEENYFIYISGSTKDDKKYEILKYGQETLVKEIKENHWISYKENEDNKITLNKNNSEILLFNIGKEITFLGKKRKKEPINSEK